MRTATGIGILRLYLRNLPNTPRVRKDTSIFTFFYVGNGPVPFPFLFSVQMINYSLAEYLRGKSAVTLCGAELVPDSEFG